MDEVWSVDQAVLAKVVELWAPTGEHVEPQRVLDAFPAEQRDAALRSLHRLSDNGFIETLSAPAMGQRVPQILMIKRVTEKGLRASGAWPTSPEQTVQVLFAVLDDAIDNAPDPEERSKFQAVKAALTGLSINAVGGFAAALIAKLAGVT